MKKRYFLLAVIWVVSGIWGEYDYCHSRMDIHLSDSPMFVAGALSGPLTWLIDAKIPDPVLSHKAAPTKEK